MAFSRIEKRHCGICPDAVGNLEQKTTTSFDVTEHYASTIDALAGQQNRTAYALRGAVRCMTLTKH